MHFLKKLGQLISSTFLKLSLLIFALALSFVSVLGTPDNLKQALKDNNTYDGVVEASLQAAANDPANQSGQLNLDSPEVKQAAKAAFPEDTMESWGGQFIDGLYGWLEGKTEKPEFQIDTSAAQQAFAQNVANTAAQKVEGLRPCSRQESLELSRQEIDLFNLPCKPQIDLASQKEHLAGEIESRNSIFGSDNVITSEDLITNAAEQEQFKNHPLPTVFQWSKQLPIIAAAVIAISTALLLWLSDDKRLGFRKIGLALIGSGLLLIIGMVLFGYLFNQADGPTSKLPDMGAEGLQASLTEVIKSLLSTFNSRVILIALIYLVIAVAMLLSLRFTKHPERAVPKRFQ